MNGLLEQFVFSASITGPICLMLFVGAMLKRIKLINENFIDIASKLVFQVSLPAMLFLSIIQNDHNLESAASLITYAIMANLAFFIFTAKTTKMAFPNSPDRGVILQGGYRANTAIIALAYVANAYGEQGVALAAIYVAPTTVLYNIQAVIALSPKNETTGPKAIAVIIKTLTKNPLIVAIFLGFAFYFLSIPVPKMLADAGGYFGNMALPLALLCTGGSLDIKALHSEKSPAWFATGYKLILCPLFITLGGFAIGFRGLELGILFLMTSAPTAAASYVMARAMGGNSKLAANIIALTTVLSLLTCTVGLFVLSSLALI